MTPVKVGLIDSMFEENHEDLNFFHIWNNSDPLPNYEYVNPNIYSSNNHGTHVAGTLAAKFNNDKGISGVIPYNKLYGVSREGVWSENSSIDGTAMEWKYMLALLIGNDVKVINVSQNDRWIGLKAIEYNATILEKFIEKIINMGYDFVIVSSAGNSDGQQACNNSVLNNIDDPNVQSRIICVGSVGMNNNDNKTTYHFSTFSNIGERVDVVAPGEKIYSTVRDNRYENGFLYYNNLRRGNWNGTSMASPHVSGTAGLLYSVNPNLSGGQVKNIIIETSGGEGREFTDSLGGSYGIINAKLAVETALRTEGENVDKNESIVFVRDYLNGTRLNNATIRIQGREAHNNDVDMYLTEGKPTNLVTGWYNITVMADGYVTYRYKYHSTEAFTTIDLVEDIPNNTGYLQITAKDWINNQNANTEFDLYTIDENYNQVKQNTNGTYATTSGITEMIALAPGYYLPETTTGQMVMQK